METLLLTYLVMLAKCVIFLWVGYGCVRTFLTIWFHSNFAVHMFKLVRILKEEDEVYTRQELSERIVTVLPDFWAELFECPICWAVWISALTALCGVWGMGLDLRFALAGLAVWPGKFYMEHRTLEQSNDFRNSRCAGGGSNFPDTDVDVTVNIENDQQTSSGDDSAEEESTDSTRGPSV